MRSAAAIGALRVPEQDDVREPGKTSALSVDSPS